MKRAARPGMPLLDLYTSAWYNRVNKALSTTQFSSNSPLSQDNRVKIDVRGDFDKDAYEPVGLSSAFIYEDSVTPEDSDQFSGVGCNVVDTPTSDNWCILQGPLAEEQSVKAVVIGMPWAKFDLRSTSDTHVDIVDDKLVSSTSGKGIIIQKSDEEGIGYGLILIGGSGGSGDSLYKYTLTSDWQLSAADATINSPRLNDPIEEDATVYDPLELMTDQTTGDVGYCILTSDGYIAIQAPCTSAGSEEPTGEPSPLPPIDEEPVVPNSAI